MLSEATRKALGKRPKCRKSLRPKASDAAKAFGKGIQGLVPNVARLLEKLLESAQNAAKAFGKGATRDLEAG